MKNSLLVIPVFLITLLSCLALCPFFYSLSQPETFYALSRGNYAFFFTETLEKAFDFLPSAAVLAFSAVFVFIACNRVKKRIAFSVFLAMLALVFAGLEPVAARLKLNLQRAKAERMEAAASGTPQAGMAQEAAPNMRAVIIEGSEEEAGVVLVAAETSGDSAGQGLRIYSWGDFGALDFVPRLSSISPEIAEKLEAPAFLKRLSQDADAVHTLLSSAAVSSAAEYFWTGGAFFALAASLFFLCALTDWKLINFLVYAFAIRALYWLFPLLCSERVIGFLRSFLPRFIPSAALSALPVLFLAAGLTAAGVAFILPRYVKKNQEG